MKTKSIKTGSAKTRESKPSFSDLKEIFTGGDNHAENAESSNVNGKQNSKDTNSMVRKDHSPSVPGTEVNYSKSPKPVVTRFDTQPTADSSRQIQSSNKKAASEFPENTSYKPYSEIPTMGNTKGSEKFSPINSLQSQEAPGITGEAKGKMGSFFNQPPPGPTKGFGDQIADGAVAKNSSIYDAATPNPKTMVAENNKNAEGLETFKASSMKQGYLDQSGEYGEGKFKEGIDSNSKFSDQHKQSVEGTAPSKAGKELDRNASMDVNPLGGMKGNLGKDGGDKFSGVNEPGKNATSKGNALKSETSKKTSDAIYSPVNAGIISQQSVIFGYIKL